MKRRTSLPLIVILVIMAGLYGCSSAVEEPAAPAATQPAATFTAPAIPTLPPRPSATFTVPPSPTTAPTPAAPTAPPVPPTEAPTQPPQPTAKPTFQPLPNGRFSGTFPGGQIVFRLNDAGAYVTLKEITLSGVECGGKKINKHMTFESISFFAIENDQFSFEVEQATVSGMFDSANTAHGTVSLEFGVNKGTCSIGPLAWTATGVRE